MIKLIEGFFLKIKYLGKIFPDTFFWVKFYYYINIFFNFRIYLQRKNYIVNNQNKIREGYYICKNYKSKELSGLIKEAVQIFKKNKTLLFQRKFNQKKKHLYSYPLEQDPTHKKDFFKLASNKIILDPVISYLSQFPVLNSVKIWYSPSNQKLVDESTQFFHIDHEDFKRIKVYIYLTDIDKDSGPLHIIPKSLTKSIYTDLKRKKKITRRNQKINDDVVFNLNKDLKLIDFSGKKGQINFVDTCNCYHFGSRPTNKKGKERLLLMLDFTTAFQRNLPFWKKKAQLNNKSDLSNKIRLLTYLIDDVKN